MEKLMGKATVYFQHECPPQPHCLCSLWAKRCLMPTPSKTGFSIYDQGTQSWKTTGINLACLILSLQINVLKSETCSRTFKLLVVELSPIQTPDFQSFKFQPHYNAAQCFQSLESKTSKVKSIYVLHRYLAQGQKKV